MKKFTVIYQEHEASLFSAPLCFVCDADDADHAQEQCENAYPQCDILWIVDTADIEEAFRRYYAAE